jgi:hypothetical protein
MNDEQQDAAWSYKPEHSATEYNAADLGSSQGVPLQKIPEVTWSASEYLHHEKTPGWYAVSASVTTVLVAIIFLVTRDVFASIVVALVAAAAIIYAARQPETKNYRLSEQGLSVGDKQFSYDQFKSFSIVSEEAINGIWLKPLKRYMPVVVLYYAPEDEERIIAVLSNFLPLEQRELDTIDRVTKRIRF